MTRSRSFMMNAGVGITAAAALWGLVQFGWYKPRADALHERIGSATDAVNAHQAALDNRPRLKRDLERFVDRTLGEDVETVDHRLRSRLNRVAEQVQLNGATVSTGRPSTHLNPARLRFPRNMPELRNEIDIVELDGSISAEGTLEQVIALVDRVEAEPWIKRIHTLRIDPKSNGEVFAVTLRLTTFFLPGRSPSEHPPPTYDPEDLTRFASLVQSNPFRLPPPQSEPRQAQERQPPQRPAPQWMMTGIAHGPGGTEAWLRNTRSGESRRLSIGERVGPAPGGAVFRSVNGQAAEFELGDHRFIVNVGEVIAMTE